MKQPTAPNLYPDLSNEDGQNYRLHKISATAESKSTRIDG